MHRHCCNCLIESAMNLLYFIATNLLRQTMLLLLDNIYLRRVNEVNVGDNVFVRCVSVCLSVCLCVGSQSDQFKMGVKCK